MRTDAGPTKETTDLDYGDTRLSNNFTASTGGTTEVDVELFIEPGTDGYQSIQLVYSGSADYLHADNFYTVTINTHT